MKKTFLTTLSICAFLALATTANAQETIATKAKNHHENSDIDAKEIALRAEIEKNSACQNILGECKKLGFVAGGFKEGKGLWRNCFAQVLESKSANLKGKEIKVSANANDVSSCKAVVKEVRKEKK
ncbi:MAG: hypothetical protein SFV53_00355 [Rickettsiales bacterium]|nr:hypothetical protein [Rickettsiales bacterium]